MTNVELIFVNRETTMTNRSCYWRLDAYGYRYLESIVYESEEDAVNALYAGRIEWWVDGK